MEGWTEEEWKIAVDQRREQIIEKLRRVEDVKYLEYIAAFIEGVASK